MDASLPQESVSEGERYNGSSPRTILASYCDQRYIPRKTASVLREHEDEVWNIKWSHDGRSLATSSKDKTVIIWRASDSGNEWVKQRTLRDHPFPGGCLAWSLDDTTLLTTCEFMIKIWNVSSGDCVKTLNNHHMETITALLWLPDESGFISAGLDRKITIWNANGVVRHSWPLAEILITDLAVTPDFTQLVAIGMDNTFTLPESPLACGHPPQPQRKNKIVVYDLESGNIIASEELPGYRQSLKISRDSQYALINHTPDEVHLLELSTQRLLRKYTGLTNKMSVIRSCFGGIEENFVASGSEDGKIYIWNRDSGALLEVLKEHGYGCVNAVAWHPKNPLIFASCSDDSTVRIWEAEGDAHRVGLVPITPSL